MRIEKRQTIGTILQKFMPEVRIETATVEVTETCAAERPPRILKWSYSTDSISSQRGHLFAGPTPFATSEFQGEAPIFSALNEAIFSLKMKKGKHERIGSLATYRSDDGKSVTRTCKTIIDFELREPPPDQPQPELR